jgi:hypothetical protein
MSWRCRLARWELLLPTSHFLHLQFKRHWRMPSTLGNSSFRCPTCNMWPHSLPRTVCALRAVFLRLDMRLAASPALPTPMYVPCLVFTFSNICSPTDRIPSARRALLKPFLLRALSTSLSVCPPTLAVCRRSVFPHDFLQPPTIRSTLARAGSAHSTSPSLLSAESRTLALPRCRSPRSMALQSSFWEHSSTDSSATPRAAAALLESASTI